MKMSHLTAPWSAIALCALLFTSATTARAEEATKPPLNILFITSDDMNYDSTDTYGGPIPNLTPNIDSLAHEGMRFEYAYSTVAVCQPVREIMSSGLYPHRNGAMGFMPLKPEVRTVNQQFHAAGYLISMFGKNPHYKPEENFCVDYAETSISRSPAKLAAATHKFIQMAKAQHKPFYHQVNCTDPHRPFIGANGPKDLANGDPPSRWVKPEEVRVPGFLEELPDVRKEVAQYFTNVRRLDDCIGAVLQALKDEGVADNTLVMFYGGDHGMSFPFAKSNDYENSSRGALFFRWPGVIKPGAVDTEHLVATIDFTPTLLAAAGLPAIPNIDGRSFLPALKGEPLEGQWDRIFTFYNQTSARTWFSMRCMRTKDHSYIWNAWSDGKTQYKAENMAGLTWKAMLAGAKTNPAIKERTDFYLYRVPEEFYDMTGEDRVERHNLIQDSSRQAEIESMRQELLAVMQRTGDPLAEAFAHRDQREIFTAAQKKMALEYAAPAKNKSGKKAKAKQRAKAAKNAAPKSDKQLIAFDKFDAVVATEPVTVLIKHQFPASDGEQSITVTMLGTPDRKRIERKVVKAKGEGEIEVTFAVPAEESGKAITFAAFVGEDFQATPQYIKSNPLNVK